LDRGDLPDVLSKRGRVPRGDTLMARTTIDRIKSIEQSILDTFGYLDAMTKIYPLAKLLLRHARRLDNRAIPMEGRRVALRPHWWAYAQAYHRIAPGASLLGFVLEER